MRGILKEAMQEREGNRIPYSTFIELALYHPEYGYYMKEKEKVGRTGDFFTSSNVSPVFAKQFARFFMHLVSDRVVPPIICEIGGGTGRFARDVLTEWRTSDPESFSKLRYIMIETSPYHRKVQLEMLSQFENIKQYASLADMPEEFEGIVFSNELYDAFPVDVVEQQNDVLCEVCVSLEDQHLKEVMHPLQNREILQYLKRHRLQLKKGQRFEIPLAMGQFVQELSLRVKRALFVTVDYGYTNEEWMHPSRRDGSLRGYYQHQLVRNPLEHPGEMDLTAHIHWDELQLAGEAAGVDTLLRMKQRSFLLSTGILQQLVNHQDRNPFSEASKQNRAIRSLILNGGMSDAFDVMIQQKGLPQLKLECYMDFAGCSPSF